MFRFGDNRTSPSAAEQRALGLDAVLIAQLPDLVNL